MRCPHVCIDIFALWETRLAKGCGAYMEQTKVRVFIPRIFWGGRVSGYGVTVCLFSLKRDAGVLHPLILAHRHALNNGPMVHASRLS